MEYTLYQKLSKIALHEQKAGLVLKNAMVVDVFTDEIRQADIAVSDGYIAAVGSSYEGEREVDLNGKYVLPGFMDSHLHLESTMVTPNELVSAAALCGTTTFIVDPHEAANVSGPDGIDYILEQTEHSPANVFVMIPSCVPATEYDDNGCLLTADKMAPYLSSARVLGLGEVMNAPGVIRADRELHRKMDIFRGKVLDGHAPYLPEDELSAYALAGISTAGSHVVLYHCFWASASDLTFWGLLFREKTSILLIAAFLGMCRVSIEGVIYDRNNLERSGDGLPFYNG